MKLFNVLPLALAVLLAACATTAPEKTEPKIPELNDTLPKLSLQTLLPNVADNEYCNSRMDSDILYGIGLSLFNNDDQPAAKSCLVMAAPKHNRAFCYLSMIAEQETDKSPEQRDRESFNYMAYSASQNDWCAEYGLYQVYLSGSNAVPVDKPLALRWLERSAMHGYPVTQQILAEQYEEQGDLASSYAWLKIIDNKKDTHELDELKAKLTPEQLAAGEQRYNELRTQVSSKETLYAEAREEDVARYSADIHLAYPDTFKGMASAERYDFVKRTMFKGIELPYIHNRDQVTSYIVVARRAQLKKPGADVLQNKQIVSVLSDEELSVDDAVKKAQAILNKAYK
ncbi:sel1 repeat family protein [Pseudomonas chlororaphis]|uniref:sel1 repeat family protein n=1 Tax=Pseudomonas chlororaphis TaxID=587753 RepID=UPI001EE4594B|nr:sel1 repeat family protein [Pseudomonas chlororaphis]